MMDAATFRGSIIRGPWEAQDGSDPMDIIIAVVLTVTIQVAAKADRHSGGCGSISSEVAGGRSKAELKAGAVTWANRQPAPVSS